jgi:hypothetical protein
MVQQFPSTNPLDFVRKFRSNYVNLHDLWSGDGVTLRDPKRSPIKESSLPEATQALLAEYRKANPGLKIVIVKYMRTVNGVPETVVDDGLELPPEDEFLSLSQTVTLSTRDHIRVVTEIIVARKK